MSSFLQTAIQYSPGMGPKKALLLQQELQLSTFEDLIYFYPFRYEDRQQLYPIDTLHPHMTYVQVRGTLVYVRAVQSGKKRLLGCLRDDSGEIMLIWFKGLQWILKKLQIGLTYTAFGKLTIYNQQLSLVHPELEVTHAKNMRQHLVLHPVYHTTEKLKAKNIDSKLLTKALQHILPTAAQHITESLPTSLLKRHGMMHKTEALLNIHFPKNNAMLKQAQFRLKFEELFYLQLQLLQLKQLQLEKRKGKILRDTQLFNQFYKTGLSFALTKAQQRVVKEVYQDLRSGYQMNRLLQGDVGSGKTIVAFLCMLFCIGSGAQVAMMAPTELLAEQHFNVLQAFAKPLNLTIALLTGSTKKKSRTAVLHALQAGKLQILVGTHALLNVAMHFSNLGLAVIDEQHRFGVMQRAQLWNNQQAYLPHVLVMTATPIPRTLAMTFYSDLDVSTLNEMPAGRKPIKTLHYYDAQRLKLFQFLREQMNATRQVYIVYPLIEESESMDYKNLMDGYESVCRAFPDFPVSIVHGQMSASDKAYEMQRFAQGATRLMVATTVIEVGVNVPNATVMVIESAERFGLAQLHQLRGRVGRGHHQSYCILMTGTQLNNKSRERIQTMVRTNNGFEIADVDLQLRGPGDLLGVQQSGVLDFKIADLSQDSNILQVARAEAQAIVKEDPLLKLPNHLPIKHQLAHLRNHTISWGNVG
ncbi:MAG: ATP-dependent DNA helicase RecG [Bacteroidota bacterium]